MKLKKIAAPSKLWKRAVAYIIDIIIVNFIVVYPFKGYFRDYENIFLEDFNFQIFSVFIVISTLTVLYWGLLEYFLRQSIGKALMNIYVKSTEKSDLAFWQCITRNLSKISTILLLVDSLKIIIRKDNQRFLEKISKTEVVDGE